MDIYYQYAIYFFSLLLAAIAYITTRQDPKTPKGLAIAALVVSVGLIAATFLYGEESAEKESEFREDVDSLTTEIIRLQNLSLDTLFEVAEIQKELITKTEELDAANIRIIDLQQENQRQLTGGNEPPSLLITAELISDVILKQVNLNPLDSPRYLGIIRFSVKNESPNYNKQSVELRVRTSNYLRPFDYGKMGVIKPKYKSMMFGEVDTLIDLSTLPPTITKEAVGFPVKLEHLSFYFEVEVGWSNGIYNCKPRIVFTKNVNNKKSTFSLQQCDCFKYLDDIIPYGKHDFSFINYVERGDYPRTVDQFTIDYYEKNSKE